MRVITPEQAATKAKQHAAFVKEENSLPILAEKLAEKWHSGQWYGNHPYTYHLKMVADLVRDQQLESKLAQAVAWLHDVLEDTACTEADILEAFPKQFGENILRAVKELTAPNGETKEQEFARLENLSWEAKMVKRADLAANMACCIASDSKYLRGYFENLPKYFQALRLAETEQERFERGRLLDIAYARKMSPEMRHLSDTDLLIWWKAQEHMANRM